MANDTDFLVFERALAPHSGMDSYFVRLTCDRDSLLAVFVPLSVTISEGFSYASPIVTIGFNDLAGVLFNTFKIDPDATYTLTFGRDAENEQSIHLKATKIMLLNQDVGKSENIGFKIFFSWQGWYGMYGKHHNRGWENVLFSDVVQQISSEGQYNSVDIYPTDRVYEHVVQPHWTNIIFLNWLRQRSISSDSIYGHYEYGCTIGGKFFYKPLSAMVDQQRDKAAREELPSFVLGGQPMSPDARKEQEEENEGLRVYFTGFTVKEHYMNSILNGAGGTLSLWFDTETGQMMTTPENYSVLRSIQLTRNGAIKQVHENSNLPVLGGRMDYTDVMAKHSVSNVVNSITSFDIVAEGSPKAEIGKLVEVIIPVQMNINPDPFNFTYSGFYLVGAVNHDVDFRKNQMKTTYTFVRQGHDNAALDGYSTSAAGRFISLSTRRFV